MLDTFLEIIILGGIMSTYFTIGEMSKLSNLPIKTLRYYDEVGVLKPAYTNPENNYRYYSMDQFMHIDVIKYCRTMGLSLEEIKDFLKSDGSIESMIDTIKRQSSLLEKKIKELSEIKNYLDDLEISISNVLEHQENIVFINRNKKRKYMEYKCKTETPEDFELSLRDTVLHIEEKYGTVYPQLGSTVSYKDFVENGKITYTYIKDFAKRKNNSKMKVLPEGEYITIIYDDNANNAKIYFNKILEYIKENNIEVVGDFNEVWVMPRVDKNTKEKTLIQLEILKKK
ncbi:MerR family transcriptional regulator [Romboutsia weinsteinii]|uniref:MerR family transcriptional regulator n=2 Tax=Romboutsia weinsteinii TaxID=2020949 RepID=A0A371J3D6_9FIRM|nr:MerR family transcriptional regulator [Romboutsia weinsteinii]